MGLSPLSGRRRNGQLSCCIAAGAANSRKTNHCAGLFTQTLVMLLALKFIAWLVEVGGLLSLHKCASLAKP